MKKATVLASSLLMCFNASAAKLYHKQTIQVPAFKHQAKSVTDFSGTWGGTCYGDALTLKIKQTAVKFSMQITDGQEPAETIDFPLNKVDFKNSASPKDSEYEFSYSNLFANTIALSSSTAEFSSTSDDGYNSIIYSTINLRMERMGDYIRITSDELPDSDDCVLAKQ